MSPFLVSLPMTNNDGTVSFVPNTSIFVAALVVAVLVAAFSLLVIARMKKECVL